MRPARQAFLHLEVGQTGIAVHPREVLVNVLAGARHERVGAFRSPGTRAGGAAGPFMTGSEPGADVDGEALGGVAADIGQSSAQEAVRARRIAIRAERDADFLAVVDERPLAQVAGIDQRGFRRNAGPQGGRSATSWVAAAW